MTTSPISKSLAQVRELIPTISSPQAGKRFVYGRLKADRAADPGAPLTFVLSNPEPDRMGDVVEPFWQLENFKANPVMLWAHDSSAPPIGKWSNVRLEGKTLLGAAIFDDDPFARSIENKVRRGFLNAVSVGFRPGAIRANSSDGFNLGSASEPNELLEVSVVPIPAHPDALLQRAYAAADSLDRANREGRLTAKQRSQLKEISRLLSG